MTLGDSKHFSELDLGNSGGVKLPEFPDSLVGKFGVPMLFALSSDFMRRSTECSKRMTHILGRGNDFEILKPVICFDPVFMVDVHSLLDRTDEGRNNGTMNAHIASASLSGITKKDDSVTVFIDGLLARALNSTAKYFSIIRDFVSGPSRNVFPSHVLSCSEPSLIIA